MSIQPKRLRWLLAVVLVIVFCGIVLALIRPRSPRRYAELFYTGATNQDGTNYAVFLVTNNTSSSYLFYGYATVESSNRLKTSIDYQGLQWSHLATSPGEGTKLFILPPTNSWRVIVAGECDPADYARRYVRLDLFRRSKPFWLEGPEMKGSSTERKD